MGTADFYSEQGITVRAIEWPYEDTGDTAGHRHHVQQRTIADYLADNKFDLVINLPMRNGGSRAASSFMTQGYKTRRMAVDYSVPLITDIKCVKLLVEVRYGTYVVFMYSLDIVTYTASSPYSMHCHNLVLLIQLLPQKSSSLFIYI